MVSLAGFEPAPHGPKPWTLPDYAIESLNFLVGLERIELPPSVSKTEMISISPKTLLGF